MGRQKIGLLIMAYGTPYKEEDIERFYTHIRRGRKPSAEALQDLTEKYQAIGGISPLAKITKAQATAIKEKLKEVQQEYEFHVYIGLRHIEPFIEDAVQQMKDDGIEQAVSLVLAPHYSTFSVQGYNGRAQDAAEEIGNIQIASVESWYQEPGFIDYWVTAIHHTYEQMSAEEREEAVLVVSAHSLPEKILTGGDPYVEQLEETARLISEKMGITKYEIGWQSEGNTSDRWIGPDVQELTRDLFEQEGYRTFVYAPVGFVADHLEVLYDNDYECKVVCADIGASYYRPEMPNTNPQFIEVLADVVLAKVKSDL